MVMNPDELQQQAGMTPDVGAGGVGEGIGVGQSAPAASAPPAEVTDLNSQPPTWAGSVNQMTRSTDDLARRMKLVRSIAPTLANARVDLVNQLASSDMTDDQLMQQTGALMGTAVTQQEAQAIGKMDHRDQQAAWGRMTPERQKAFLALGFDFGQQPKQGGFGSLGGHILHDVGAGLGDVAGAVTGGIGKGLHDLGAPLRNVQHAARWGKYWELNGTLDGAWSRTTNGERWFTPKAVQHANDELGDMASADTMQIAQRLAGGDSIEDLVAASGAQPGSQEYSDTYSAMMNMASDPRMSSAVTKLTQGKYSFGRSMAYTFGLDPSSMPFHVTSGAFDALFDIVLDPLQIAGKVAKGGRMARYGVDLLDGAPNMSRFGLAAGDLDKLDATAEVTKATRLEALQAGRAGSYYRQLAQLPVNPVQRYATMVADHFAVDGAPKVAELAQADPHISKVLTDLSNWNLLLKNESSLANAAEELSSAGTGISKPSDVARFLNDATGASDIMRGRWGSYLHRGVEMPHMTKLQSARAATKIGMTSTINFLADDIPDFAGDVFATGLRGEPTRAALDSASRQFASGVGTLGLEDPGLGARLQAGGYEAIHRFLQPAAKMLKGATTLQPTRDVMQLAGEHTFEGLDRFLAFGMSGDERAELVNQYFNSAPGARLSLLKGAIVKMAEKAGINDTAAGREFVENVANGGLQQYAPNSSDLMETPFGPTSQGIMPKADMAFGVGLPGYREWEAMAGQGRRLSLTHTLFGSTPASMADAFLSSYWKPSVLMRVGFIPRVAGEEALGAVARLGATFLPGNWLGAIGGEPDTVNLLPFRAARSVLTHGIAEGEDLRILQEAGGELTGTQQARRMLASYVEKSGRVFTPWVRSAARGGQAALVTAGRLGEGGLPQAVGRAARGGEFAAEPYAIGEHITQAREASAAAQLGRAVNRAGEIIGPGGKVIDLDRAEIETRLRMAGRFSRDPRIQDAYARALAGGIGKVSSNRMNLVTAGDDPRMTVLDRGAPSQDPTVMRLKPVGSEYETYYATPQKDNSYGLHNVLFDHTLNWQIGRMADDPVMAAGALARSAYVAPSQARELEEIAGVADGHQFAGEVRRAYGASTPEVQELVRKTLAGDAEAQVKLRDLGRAEQVRPEIQHWMEHVGQLSPGTNNMLAVDLAKAHAAITGVDLERAAAGVVDTASTTGREAMSGDAGAALDANAALARGTAAAAPVPTTALPPEIQATMEQHLASTDPRASVTEYLSLDHDLMDTATYLSEYGSTEEMRQAAADLIESATGPAEWLPYRGLSDEHIANLREGEQHGPSHYNLSISRSQDGVLGTFEARMQEELKGGVSPVVHAQGQSLIDRMAGGDRSAVDEAAREATRRRLMAPDMQPYRDLSLRNYQTSDGHLLQQPVDARHARLYGVLADPKAARALANADRAAALGAITDKRLAPIVSALIDEGTRMGMSPEQLQAVRSSSGRSVLAPLSSVVTEDPQLAQQISDAISEAMMGAGVDVGVIPPMVGQADVHRAIMGEHTTQVADGVYQGGAGVLAKLAPAQTEITHADVIDDWVDRLLELQEHRMTSRADGRVLHEVTRPTVDRDWDMGFLRQMDGRDLPVTEIGPKYTTAHEGVWSKITRWGFNKVLGPGIDAMIRTPLFAEHYQQAVRDLAPIERMFTDDKLAAQAEQIMAKKNLNPDFVREAMRDLNIDGLTFKNGEWPSAGDVREHLPLALAGRFSDDEILRMSRWASRSANESAASPIFDESVGEMVATKRRAGPISDSVAEWMRDQGLQPREVYKMFTKDLPGSVWNPHIPSEDVDVNALRRGLPDHVAGGLSDGQLVTLRNWHSNLESAEQHAHDVAIDRATNEIIPYIHDHALRSQAQEWTRHFVPFEFAEEQFLKRWARTLTHSPEALQKGMLLMNGMRHSGMVQKDNYGNDVFIYPGSAALTGAIASGLKLFTGSDYNLPIGVPLSGAVKYAVPGLDHEGLPGVSPIVGVALGGLRRRFPEFNIEATLEGERGAGHSFLDQLVPAPAVKLYRFYHDDPERDPKLGSASIQVMAMMAAKDREYFKRTGQHLDPGMAENAGDHEKEAYISRVANYTRTMMLARGLMGFGMPASPSPIYPGDLHPQLIKLMGAFPNDPGQAFAEFIRQHPDAQPYEVFGTKSFSGAPLSATDAVGHFLRGNEDFVTRYKNAGAWFLPQASVADPSSRQVYNRMLADGLRIHKGPAEWMDDYYFSSAAPTYFDSRDLHDKAMAKLKNNPMARQNETADWKRWEAQYLLQHPTFEKVLNSSDRAEQRRTTLQEMRLALNDPSLPEASHTQNLKDMVQGVDRYNAALGRLGSRRDTMSMARRHTIQASFTRWASTYTRTNPDVQAFFDRVIKPDLKLPANLTSELEVSA